ncbi:MAG TPA: hypothetical protein VLX56_02810 [Nitrososphaerales archaeon]|nr:hypothetical protein [Nitrososphaerales archaeon]
MAALSTLALLISPQGAFAAAITTGTASFGNALTYGNTSYSVAYSYPSVAAVGSPFNITLTLHVNSLTGLIEYITAYRMIVFLFISNGNVINNSLISNVTASYMFPGANWGPNNMTFDLTPTNTGVSKGQSANATVSIQLQDDVYYGNPRYDTETEPGMQGSAGAFVIENGVATSTTTGSQSSGGTNYLSYALVTSGIVLIVLAVVVTREPKSGAPPTAS